MQLGKKVSALSNLILGRVLDFSIRNGISRKVLSPPIFIIGAPRSGSTLLIQSVIQSFDIGFLNNLHSRFYGAPELVELYFFSNNKKVSRHFESIHGETPGNNGPSECGEFWYQFFRRRPAYVPLNDISEKNLYRFRRAVNSLINCFGKPTVFKNMYAALRLQPIITAFPNALFIQTNRDELEIGRSLLEVRKRIFDSYDHWWSMEPPNIGKIRALPCEQQVIEQVRSIYKTIKEDFQEMKIDNKQVHQISYEDLCNTPKIVMDQIEGFLLQHSVAIKRLPDCLPKNFKSQPKNQVPRALLDKMAQYATES